MEHANRRRKHRRTKHKNSNPSAPRRRRRHTHSADRRPLVQKKAVGRLPVTRNPHMFYWVSKAGVIYEGKASKRGGAKRKAGKKGGKRKGSKKGKKR